MTSDSRMLGVIYISSLSGGSSSLFTRFLVTHDFYVLTFGLRLLTAVTIFDTSLINEVMYIDLVACNYYLIEDKKL